MKKSGGSALKNRSHLNYAEILEWAQCGVGSKFFDENCSVQRVLLALDDHTCGREHNLVTSRGMDVLAATLMQYANEEEAFWILAGLAKTFLTGEYVDLLMKEEKVILRQVRYRIYAVEFKMTPFRLDSLRV